MEFSRGNQCPRLSKPLSLLNDNLYRITVQPLLRIIEQLKLPGYFFHEKRVCSIRQRGIPLSSYYHYSFRKNSAYDSLTSKSVKLNLSSNLQTSCCIVNKFLVNESRKKKESKEKYMDVHVCIIKYFLLLVLNVAKRYFWNCNLFLNSQILRIL